MVPISCFERVVAIWSSPFASVQVDSSSCSAAELCFFVSNSASTAAACSWLMSESGASSLGSVASTSAGVTDASGCGMGVKIVCGMGASGSETFDGSSCAANPAVGS